MGICAILYRLNTESMTGKVLFEQRTERNKELSHGDMKERSILG